MKNKNVAVTVHAESHDNVWHILAQLPTGETIQSSCREKRNVARTAREISSEFLRIPETRVTVSGVKYL